LNAGQELHNRGRSDNADDFRRVFVVRVHELLALGYARLPHADYAETDEPSITGFLAEAVRELLDDPPEAIDSWCDNYSIADEAPENTEGRTGKGRRKIDIRFESSEQRPRNRFRFEAKVLRTSVTEYFSSGLRRFLIGAYAPDDDDAGMLGYVQRRSEVEWAKELESRLESDKTRLRVTVDGLWSAEEVSESLRYSYRSRHTREHQLGDITLYHTLLRFY
jgi:hypothetical protein